MPLSCKYGDPHGRAGDQCRWHQGHVCCQSAEERGLKTRKDSLFKDEPAITSRPALSCHVSILKVTIWRNFSVLGDKMQYLRRDKKDEEDGNEFIYIFLSFVH